MAKRKHGDKPKISPETRARIMALAKIVERAQKRTNIAICVQDDTIVFRDMLRTDDYDDPDYETWDAQIFNAEANPGVFKAENVVIEDFNWWEG